MPDEHPNHRPGEHQADQPAHAAAPDPAPAPAPAPTPALDPAMPPPEDDPGDSPSVFERLGPAAWLGIAWASLPMVLGLTIFVRYRGEVANWLRQHEDLGPAAYLGAFVVTAGLGLLPTWTQAVIGGYAFGQWVGFALALIGFTGAAVIGFFVTKTIAGDRVEQEIERHTKAKIVRDALVGSGPAKTLWIVMLVRMPPNSPFSLMNLVLTSVRVPFGTYLAGTLIGMAPRTFVYAMIGASIVSFDKLKQPGWLVWGGIGASLVILFILSHIANKALERALGGKVAGNPVPTDEEAHP